MSRIAEYDDTLVAYDDALCTYDGEVSEATPEPTPTLAPTTSTSVAAHSLLTPQNILRAGAGGQWSREEAERWTNRIRDSLKQQERDEQRRLAKDEKRNQEQLVALEAEEALGIVLALLLAE